MFISPLRALGHAILLAAAATVAAAQAPAPAAGNTALTLRVAIEQALAMNPDLRGFQHRLRAQACPCHRHHRYNSSASRVFPIPGSPEINTTPAPLSTASCQAFVIRSHSVLRPTMAGNSCRYEDGFVRARGMEPDTGSPE